jgi:hypothetical protein
MSDAGFCKTSFSCGNKLVGREFVQSLVGRCWEQFVLRLRSLGIKSRLDYSSYLNSTGKFGAKIIHRAIRDAEIHGISRGGQQIGPRVWLLCCPRKKMLLDGSLI